METTDIKIEKPQAAEIPAGEVAHSLMALIHTHAKPDEPPAAAISQMVEGLESTFQQGEGFQRADRIHSRRISEMLHAIGQLLEMMHDRLIDDPRPKSIEVSPEIIEGIQQIIGASEERQLNTIEAALKQLESERKSHEAERMIHMESLQVQAQIEVNRLLRVMWIGTGLAATGAGTALFLMRT